MVVLDEEDAEAVDSIEGREEGEVDEEEADPLRL